MLAMARSSLVGIGDRVLSAVGPTSDRQAEKRHPAMGAIRLTGYHLSCAWTEQVRGR
jgi:hypothetical protein